MSNLFYRAFEDQHRGSREVIKERLRAYEAFLQPLRATMAQPTALDLGCGRGEWLELLTEHGFDAHGVDLDEGMLAACRERGLQVQTQDALSGLRAQADASLALVSAFHLIEHIPFDDVQELIGEALRVLQPGGLLIMETPNPENLVVATSGFYMDPSHLRPIPPMLLEFVVGFEGFPRHKVLRLQEPVALRGPVMLEPVNLLNGVSPDFSVIAQKTGPQDLLARFDAAFSLPFGIELADLSSRYQQQQEDARTTLQAGISKLDERVAAVERETVSLFDRALSVVGESNKAIYSVQMDLSTALQRERSLADRSRELEHQIRHLNGQANENERRLQEAFAGAAAADERAVHLRHALALTEERASEAEAAIKLVEQTRHIQWQLDVALARVAAAERAITLIHRSTSWRLTAPVRLIARVALRGTSGLRLSGLRSRTVRALRRIAAWAVRKIISHGRLARWGMAFLARRPALKARLRLLVGSPSAWQANPEGQCASAVPPNADGSAQITPRAARLLADLQKAGAERKY